MRVVQLGPYPPPHGGVQTHIVALRARLLKEGIACAVINITAAPESGTEGVHYPRSAPALVRRLLGLRPEIVHLHLGGHLSNRLLALAGVCTTVPGSHSVLTFHSGGYPSSPDGRTAGAATLRGGILRRFDRIIAVNEEQVRMFHSFGCRPDRVRLIPPHARPDQQPGGEIDSNGRPLPPPEFRDFFSRHDPVFVSVGLLEPEYDLARQMDSLARVRAFAPNAGLVVIGSGSLEEELRQHLEQSPAREHIRLCGDVPHEGTMRVIGASRLLLRTTLHDGDSISVREALALGTPVLATDTGMRPAGVQLVPIGDTEGLVSGIRAALDAPPADRATIGNEDNIGAVLSLYREIVA